MRRSIFFTTFDRKSLVFESRKAFSNLLSVLATFLLSFENLERIRTRRLWVMFEMALPTSVMLFSAISKSSLGSRDECPSFALSIVFHSFKSGPVVSLISSWMLAKSWSKASLPGSRLSSLSSQNSSIWRIFPRFAGTGMSFKIMSLIFLGGMLLLILSFTYLRSSLESFHLTSSSSSALNRAFLASC